MAATYTFEKSEILETLKTNRRSHRAIFLEALKGYQEEAIKEFQKNIDKIRKGKLVSYVSMRLPQDNTSDYDRIISLLELSKGSEIELTEEQFAHYILDDWDWKQSFIASNAQYSVTASNLVGDSDD